MTEPPSKRRRPDSNQMWDASDRHAPLPSRGRDDPPALRDRDRDRDQDRDRDRDRSGRDRDRGHRDDRDRDYDRHRRYRSRSPRDAKGRGDRGREADYRGSERERRGGRGGIDDRRDGGRDPRDRPRDRSKERNWEGRRRSRSPRRERERDRDKENDREGTEVNRAGDSESLRERDKEPRSERTEDHTASGAATPPVSFRVGTTPQPNESENMDVDAKTTTRKARNGTRGKKAKVEEPTEDDDIVIEDDGMAAMQAMMGFGGFGTTHQKKVAGNDVYAVRKEKKSEYRQYMNRTGGFNRPLSPSRD